MSELVKWIGYVCALVCIALIGVGVLVYYIIRSVVSGTDEDVDYQQEKE